MAHELTHKPTEPRWVTAIFESHADAEGAKKDVIALGIAADDIEIRSAAAQAADPARSDHETGLLKSILDIFAFMPSEDRLSYEEAVHRGGVALAVRTATATPPR